MPRLIPIRYLEGPTPVKWQCSICAAYFSACGRATALTLSECREIDDMFEAHCREYHPNHPVIGLESLAS